MLQLTSFFTYNNAAPLLILKKNELLQEDVLKQMNRSSMQLETDSLCSLVSRYGGLLRIPPIPFFQSSS